MLKASLNRNDHRIGKFFTWGIFYYAIATLTKMLLYATVIPYNTIESENYSLTQELMKIVINCIEVFFIMMALKNKSNFTEGKESHLKVLTVSLSWSLAESVFSYLLYFLMNATSDEFKWEFIQTSIISNIDLIERISLVAIVEAYRSLKESESFSLHLMVLILLKFALGTLGPKYIQPLSTSISWNYIQARLGIALVFALLSKLIFNSVCSKSEGDTQKKNN